MAGTYDKRLDAFFEELGELIHATDVVYSHPIVQELNLPLLEGASDEEYVEYMRANYSVDQLFTTFEALMRVMDTMPLDSAEFDLLCDELSIVWNAIPESQRP